MANRTAGLCLLSIVILAVTACSSSSSKAPEENPNQFPANYKEEILNTMSRTLDDPTNIRDAYISEPVIRRAGIEERYIVCVRSNSRDVSKQYIGSKDRVGYFYAGHLNQLVEATNGQCANAAYKPFPELEKLCQAKKCT
ncbi:MAG TPA: hypothetical protein VKG24_26765 [Pseudolabrys sp.]|nr:hypothetical protein [Pseudolabrys sp.]